MANSLPVTLDTSTNPATVKVDNTALNKSAEPQMIKWYLDGNAKDGTFGDLTWIDPKPPPGVFGTFTTFEGIDGRKWATLSDLHPSTASRGTFVYRLSVTHNGHRHHTPKPPVHPHPGTGTPNIKNN
jgi:hypothetical protein